MEVVVDKGKGKIIDRPDCASTTSAASPTNELRREKGKKRLTFFFSTGNEGKKGERKSASSYLPIMSAGERDGKEGKSTFFLFSFDTFLSPQEIERRGVVPILSCVARDRSMMTEREKEEKQTLSPPSSPPYPDHKRAAYRGGRKKKGPPPSHKTLFPRLSCRYPPLHV